MSDTEIIIREHIAKLLAHEIDLAQFEHWFFTEASNAEDDIAYDIKLLFAEYDHGDWIEQEMLKHLRDILYSATIGEMPAIQIRTGTSSTTQEHKI